MATAKEKLIGKMIHYYDKIGVGIIKLSAGLAVEDQIRVKGSKTDFTQSVGSMQIEHEQMKKAKKGDVIGIKVDSEVKENDLVYKVA